MFIAICSLKPPPHVILNGVLAEAGWLNFVEKIHSSDLGFGLRKGWVVQCLPPQQRLTHKLGVVLSAYNGPPC